MRRALVLLLLALACCTSSPTTVPFEDACLEQAASWCGYFERCYGAVDGCEARVANHCLANIPDDPELADQEACLEALDTGVCGQGRAWWPAACQETGSGSP